MTKKKQTDKKAAEKELIDVETGTAPTGNNQSTEETNQAEETIRLKEEIANLNDKYLRLYSEFDNYRKRTLKERAEMLQTAGAGIITQLLPVLDDFDRALRSMEGASDPEAVKEGILLINTKFRKVLEQKGLEEMQPIGEPFSTDFHEAITSLPVEDASQKGKVLDVVEKGYLLNGKVIRFARVAVGN
ncbi:MAG TPA: nucleotide exchange factor GrpE [Bacteroidales bacterium]|nr:nucleotide exchange factor GrpE [Bacteroidales bacterium]HRZ49186.1 nucleotide exchange factor GrpE [Bacteroidales bacterium]